MAESRTGANTSPSLGRDELAEVTSHQAPSVSNTEGGTGVHISKVQTPVTEDQGEKIPLAKDGEGLGCPESSAPAAPEPIQ